MKTVQVYNTIKDFILTYQILPGERIYIESLSKSLKISPTPLREALNRLVQEGYVTHVSNRGYTLSAITIDEVEKLYEFCEALETFTIERALGNLTESTLAELRDNLSKYRQLVEGNFAQERWLLNNQFHIKIAELSGNTFIVTNLTQAFEKLLLKRKIENLTQGERGPQAYKEHEAIYNSIEKRDAAGAVEKMRIHIIHAKQFVLRYLKEKENLFKNDSGLEGKRIMRTTDSGFAQSSR
jgi:DNA-binding GntR family transcriptional regulator